MDYHENHFETYFDFDATFQYCDIVTSYKRIMVFIKPEMVGVVEFTNLKHSLAKIYVKLKMSFNEIVTVVEYLITCFL